MPSGAALRPSVGSGRTLWHDELRELIRRMARENVLWGEERIANELLLKVNSRCRWSATHC